MFSCWNTHTVIKWDTMRQRKKTCYNRWRDMNKKMMKHILEYVVQIHIQFNIVSQSNKCFEQKYWLLDGINIMTLFKNDTKRKPLLDEMNVFPISVSLCMFVWGFFFLFAFESWLTDRDPFISQSKHFGNISYTCFKSLAAFGLWNWQSAGKNGNTESIVSDCVEKITDVMSKCGNVYANVWVCGLCYSAAHIIIQNRIKFTSFSYLLISLKWMLLVKGVDAKLRNQLNEISNANDEID